jgi:hypothetical protein
MITYYSSIIERKLGILALREPLIGIGKSKKRSNLSS